MRNALQIGTWKRLTCALALTAAVTFIAPAPSNAGPQPTSCGPNQATWIHYYSDPYFEHHMCQDVLYPCPGSVRTYYCRGSETPYSKRTCHSCPLN